jgi:hypothetical protein
MTTARAKIRAHNKHACPFDTASTYGFAEASPHWGPLLTDA